MVYVPVQCPHCQSTEVIKAGKQPNGPNAIGVKTVCASGGSFSSSTRIAAGCPKSAGRSSRWRSMAGGFAIPPACCGISPTTVIAVLKKSPPRFNPSTPRSYKRSGAHGNVSVKPGRAAEVDEMWSFVGDKDTARWLWHAIDHCTGRVLAYVVGTRKDAEFLKLHALLVPFGITRYYTDTAGVYQRHLPPEQPTVGKLTRRSSASISRCGRA